MKPIDFTARFGAVRFFAFVAAALLAAPALAQSPTRTRPVSVPNPSAVGQPVTLTAEVDGLGGGAPTGTVAFSFGGAVLGSAALVAPGANQAVLAAGFSHACALTSAGGVKCWGGNTSGQIGDGRTGGFDWFVFTPLDVAGLTTGVVAVASSHNHSCALTVAGAAKCWGRNFEGQRGDGTTLSGFPSIPTDVVGLSSGVVAISAGHAHSCAVIAGGGVKCWGSNGGGALGDGTATNRLTPVDVVGLSSGVVAVAAGGSHSCALTAAGGVKCWGNNNFGQLGDGTRTLRRTPVDVVGLTSGVAAIASGAFHSCALTVAGGVKCWGDNRHAQLGDGTYTNRFAPVDVSGLSSGVATVSTGYYHSCALTVSGAGKCWGDNQYDQLGSARGSAVPVDVVGLSSGGVAIAAGARHSCALTSAGGVKPWGGVYFANTTSLVTVVRSAAPLPIPNLGTGLLRAVFPGDAAHTRSFGLIRHRVQ